MCWKKLDDAGDGYNEQERRGSEEGKNECVSTRVLASGEPCKRRSAGVCPPQDANGFSKYLSSAAKVNLQRWGKRE